jgi:hypothetical protein
MAYEELCRRYVSGVCATLLVEAIGHGTASTEELEDEVIMNKRQIIFQRCVDTDHIIVCQPDWSFIRAFCGCENMSFRARPNR